MSEHTLDERGHACPYPVIALGHLWERLRNEPGKHTIVITADDPVAVIDIPAWCDIKSVDYERIDDHTGPNITFQVTFLGR